MISYSTGRDLLYDRLLERIRSAFVVSNKAGGPIRDSGRMWPAHFGIVGFILIAAIALPYLAQRLSSSDPFVSLLSAQQGLQREPDVRHATVNIGVIGSISKKHGATTTHIFNSKFFESRRVTDLDSLANRSRLRSFMAMTLESQRRGGVGIPLSLLRSDRVAAVILASSKTDVGRMPTDVLFGSRHAASKRRDAALCD